ncbi:hypothetical protein N8897_01880, partial [Candidatus Pelagibacter sp.]|nr:hypothetical protein [Candidatus Pelagibacter sp.]
MNIKDNILKFYKLIVFTFKKKINLDTLNINEVNLNELFNLFGSDKGTSVTNPYSKSNHNSKHNKIGHGYGDFYENHLKHIKNKKIKILEIGTWKGASVAA